MASSTTLTLELPESLAGELSAEAQRLGLPVEEYARTLLTGRSGVPSLRTGADLVTYWRQAGVIGSRPDIESAPAHARELRRRAEQRSRA